MNDGNRAKIHNQAYRQALMFNTNFWYSSHVMLFLQCQRYHLVVHFSVDEILYIL